LKSILYTKDFNQEINEPVNVILSPEFYWIKKVNLNIKSLKDLKKIAKNEFKLDENQYIFDSFKINEIPFIIAFEKNLNINIPKKYIHSIKIAQIEFFNYECITINKNKNLEKIDDLIFLLPKTKDCKKIDEVLKEIKLSNKSFNIINNVNIDKTAVFFGILIFLIINISLIIQTLTIKKETNALIKQREKYLKSKSLPTTNIQLKSILNNLKSEYKNQIKLKRSLEIITKTPLKKDEYFKRLQFDGNNFIIEIKTNRNFDSFFKKNFQIISSSHTKNSYKATLK